ncbi:hypothetical protein XENTR_v10020275 [Xenopus tropicalis]|nr:hypothetical protein XENTR_v10020275 [Xenopus tropicalis]
MPCVTQQHTPSISHIFISNNTFTHFALLLAIKICFTIFFCFKQEEDVTGQESPDTGPCHSQVSRKQHMNKKKCIFIIFSADLRFSFLTRNPWKRVETLQSTPVRYGGQKVCRGPNVF